MTFRKLIQNSLSFHWRSHLGVVLGAAIGSAALIGALVVGDSVRESLREQARQRLGQVHFALTSGDRLFRSELAGDFQNLYTTGYSGLSGGNFAAALQFQATASRTDGGARANQVNLFGVDTNWPALGGDARFATAPTNGVWLNESLAAHLNVAAGDSVLLRLPKPTALSQEASIAQRDEQNIVIRTEVLGVVPATALGNFSLRAGQTAGFNAFMNLHTLQSAAGVAGQANLLLVSNWELDLSKLELPLPPPPGAAAATKTAMPTGDQSAEQHSALLLELLNCPHDLWQVFKLDDFQLKLRTEGTNAMELISPRIFLDPPAVQAATLQTTNAQPLVTYLANLLRAGTNATPYSMVTAAGTPWTPENLRDDEIVVSQWLAEDLRVQPGDEIAVSYFLPESGAKLEEATNTFRVHSIVPLVMPWADRTLMPEFPGIEKAESTSEWDAGFPLTYEIRKKDDDYWKEYRGTPKAFITLAAGKKMWGNRFGEMTAIRFPIPSGSTATNYQADLERTILANLKPEQLGLRFEPVREQALKGAAESQDFGGLFLGFSFFLIIAALLLMALLFQFGLEQRAPEIGTLLALGFTPGQVRKTLISEGVALAFGGGIIGAISGMYFAKGMLHGLTTIWRDAVGATALNFHVTGPTLLTGLFASVVVSTITIWLALRKFVKRPARELLVGEIHADETKARSAKQKIAALAALLTAVALVGWAVVSGETANAGIFFGAGALVLIAGLSFVSMTLGRMTGAPVSDPARSNGKSQRAGPEAGAPITTVSLAVRGCARRRKRSLATVAMLACGSFLIVSIGVFRLDANRDATQKTSGTGGFALIGETTAAVVQDLNTSSGRDFYALNERDLAGVNFVPFRVRAGDEASCLNLNRAQKPRLLGVRPEMLEGRFFFVKAAAEIKEPKTWKSLAHLYWFKDKEIPLLMDEIPAIGDANSIQWAMGKKVGDTIDYVDERGQPFKVRIVGAVANSILQGQLIIDETEFVKRFPGEAGYRTFLIDAPSNSVAQVSATLSRALQDAGLELTPTSVRLNQFNAVQNTYLGTFQVLGGLGLLLGSVGLGIVVLRNVLERRSELALLLAVGFRKAQVQRLLLLENGALLLAGLTLGILAATIAVLPAVLAPTGQLPYASLTITLAAVLLNGAWWTWVATRFAVRGDLLAALRND